jgi:Predicted permease.
MKYSLYQALIRVKMRWATYLLMMIQFIIGYALLSICINIILSTHIEVTYFQSDISEIMRLSWNSDNQINSNMRISRQIMRGLDVAYADNIDLITIYQKPMLLSNLTNSNSEFVHVLFIDDAFVDVMGSLEYITQDEKMVFIDSLPMNTSLIPSEILNILGNNVNNNAIYHIKPSRLSTFILNSFYLVDQSASVPMVYLVPVSMRLFMDNLSDGDKVQHFLKAKASSSVPAENIIQTLYEIAPTGVDFYIENILQAIEFDIEAAQMTSQSILLLAWVSILAVSIGFIGSFMITLEKRKREYCVLLCIGVPRYRLTLELFIETTLIVSLSAGIGAFAGSLITASIAFRAIVVRQYWISIVGPVIASLIFCGILALIQLLAINRMNIAYKLKEEDM